MKTLSQITEDFKISKSTKIATSYKVLAFRRDFIVANNFETDIFVQGNYMSLIFCQSNKYKFIIIGENTGRRDNYGWKELSDIDKATTLVHNWKKLPDLDYSKFGNSRIYHVYSTVFTKEEIAKLANNDDISFFYYAGNEREVLDVIKHYIDKGYLNNYENIDSNM